MPLTVLHQAVRQSRASKRPGDGYFIYGRRQLSETRKTSPRADRRPSFLRDNKQPRWAQEGARDDILARKNICLGHQAIRRRMIIDIGRLVAQSRVPRTEKGFLPSPVSHSWYPRLADGALGEYFRDPPKPHQLRKIRPFQAKCSRPREGGHNGGPGEGQRGGRLIRTPTNFTPLNNDNDHKNNHISPPTTPPTTTLRGRGLPRVGPEFTAWATDSGYEGSPCRRDARVPLAAGQRCCRARKADWRCLATFRRVRPCHAAGPAFGSNDSPLRWIAAVQGVATLACHLASRSLRYASTPSGARNGEIRWISEKNAKWDGR